MTFTRALILFLFGALFLSCGGKNPYEVSTEMVDGIKVITNPDSPRDGKVSYEMIQEISIGEEGGEDYILNRPQQVRVDDRGWIFILDWGDVNIKVYDDTGTFVRTIGRIGQGPGEFDTPCSFDISSEGQFVIMDGRNQRVVILDSQGTYQGGFRLSGFHSEMVLGPLKRAYFQRTVNNAISGLTDQMQELSLTVRIKRAGLDGEGMTRLGDFEGPKTIMKRTASGQIAGIASRYEQIVWNIRRDGKLLIGFSADYRIRVMDLDARIEFIFGRRYTPIESASFYGREIPERYMPAYYPSFVFDDDDNLWLRQFVPADFQGVVYDVFDPKGIYIKQVTLPLPIHAFKKGKAYSIIQTDDGFPMVIRSSLR